MARSEYKIVKAEVEERIDLLKRMTDGQAWETIKLNLKIACNKTVGGRKEADEEREANLLKSSAKTS